MVPAIIGFAVVAVAVVVGNVGTVGNVGNVVRPNVLKSNSGVRAVRGVFAVGN